jgi:hypothetical protein
MPVSTNERAPLRTAISAIVVLCLCAVGFTHAALAAGGVAPSLAFSTLLFGAAPHDVAVGPDGSLYVAGTAGAEFKTVNAFQPAFGGLIDVFVMKIDVARGRVVYATFVGGVQQEQGGTIAVDATGAVYVGGLTTSFDFPLKNALQPHIGSDDTGAAGGSDGFVTKLDPSGRLVYSTYFGGYNDEDVSDLAVDAAGAVYLTGLTRSADLPLANAIQTTYLGGPQSATSFVAELSPAGDALVFSTYLGSASGGSRDVVSLARGVAVAADGSIAVAGSTGATDFPLVDPAQVTYGGEGDAYVTMLAPGGTGIVFSTFVGGNRADLATAIAFDAEGAVHVCGSTQSPDLPTTDDAFQREFQNGAPSGQVGAGDVFYAKIPPEGSSFGHVTYLGGTGDDYPFDLDLDGRGNVYLTGFAASPDFPLTPNAIQSTYGGDGPFAFPIGDVFVTCLSASGYAPLYSTFLGGQGTDNAYAIEVTPEGVAYLGGITGSREFPLVRPLSSRFGRYQLVGFISEISPPFPSVTSAVYTASTRTLKIVAGGPLGAEVAVEINGVHVSPPLPAVINARKGRVKVKGSAADLHLDESQENSIVLVVDGVASDPYRVELR